MEGEDRGGEKRGQGRAGKKRGGEKKRRGGWERMGPHFLGQVYAPGQAGYGCWYDANVEQEAGQASLFSQCRYSCSYST